MYKTIQANLSADHGFVFPLDNPAYFARDSPKVMEQKILQFAGNSKISYEQKIKNWFDSEALMYQLGQLHIARACAMVHAILPRELRDQVFDEVADVLWGPFRIISARVVAFFDEGPRGRPKLQIYEPRMPSLRRLHRCCKKPFHDELYAAWCRSTTFAIKEPSVLSQFLAKSTHRLNTNYAALVRRVELLYCPSDVQDAKTVPQLLQMLALLRFGSTVRLKFRFRFKGKPQIMEWNEDELDELVEYLDTTTTMVEAVIKAGFKVEGSFGGTVLVMPLESGFTAKGWAESVLDMERRRRRDPDDTLHKSCFISDFY